MRHLKTIYIASNYNAQFATLIVTKHYCKHLHPNYLPSCLCVCICLVQRVLFGQCFSVHGSKSKYSSRVKCISRKIAWASKNFNQLGPLSPKNIVSFLSYSMQYLGGHVQTSSKLEYIRDSFSAISWVEIVRRHLKTGFSFENNLKKEGKLKQTMFSTTFTS